MLVTTDPRLTELKLLQNLADGTWRDGVCTAEAAGQTSALGLSQQLYADLLVTLFEDGFLQITSEELSGQLSGWLYRKTRGQWGFRQGVVTWLCTSPVFHAATVTYRGRRHIDELRDRLRRDRVLERFGILLDGRYIVSDLIRFLESANGAPVSLLFADVDDFKQFNSKYGYKAGDDVLRHVFTIARRIIGNRGEVYRRGGEEIVAVLPYCGLDVGRDAAERIREEVANTTVAYDQQELYTTLSIGVAASPPRDPDGTALETHAENALNRAKAEGKNRVVVDGSIG
jgi:diguanylate cyclase (GGDEF)-like protein